MAYVTLFQAGFQRMKEGRVPGSCFAGGLCGEALGRGGNFTGRRRVRKGKKEARTPSRVLIAVVISLVDRKIRSRWFRVYFPVAFPTQIPPDPAIPPHAKIRKQRGKKTGVPPQPDHSPFMTVIPAIN